MFKLEAVRKIEHQRILSFRLKNKTLKHFKVFLCVPKFFDYRAANSFILVFFSFIFYSQFRERKKNISNCSTHFRLQSVMVWNMSKKEKKMFEKMKIKYKWKKRNKRKRNDTIRSAETENGTYFSLLLYIFVYHSFGCFFLLLLVFLLFLLPFLRF